MGRPPSYLVLVVAVLAAANLYFETSICDITLPADETGSTPFSKEPLERARVGLDRRNNVTSPHDEISNMLPDKLYIIYGLENSGTTFTAKTICSALGIPPILNPDTASSHDKRLQIQHISLPLGAFRKERWFKGDPYTQPLHVAPVMYPTGCGVLPYKDRPPTWRKTPPACRAFMGDRVMSAPHRYMVNITTHVQWYRKLGVQVFPIMVVRDPSLRLEGILNWHCKHEEGAWIQYEQGRSIMLESMDTIHPTIVSYEVMMTLKAAYIKKLFQTLNLETDFMPTFRDGNVKRAPETTPQTIHYMMMKDSGIKLQVAEKPVEKPQQKKFSRQRGNYSRPAIRSVNSRQRAFLPDGGQHGRRQSDKNL